MENQHPSREESYAELMIHIDIRKSTSEAIRAECGDRPFWRITRKVMDSVGQTNPLL